MMFMNADRRCYVVVVLFRCECLFRCPVFRWLDAVLANGAPGASLARKVCDSFVYLVERRWQVQRQCMWCIRLRSCARLCLKYNLFNRNGYTVLQLPPHVVPSHAIPSHPIPSSHVPSDRRPGLAWPGLMGRLARSIDFLFARVALTHSMHTLSLAHMACRFDAAWPRAWAFLPWISCWTRRIGALCWWCTTTVPTRDTVFCVLRWGTCVCVCVCVGLRQRSSLRTLQQRDTTFLKSQVNWSCSLFLTITSAQSTQRNRCRCGHRELPSRRRGGTSTLVVFRTPFFRARARPADWPTRQPLRCDPCDGKRRCAAPARVYVQYVRTYSSARAVDTWNRTVTCLLYRLLIFFFLKGRGRAQVASLLWAIARLRETQCSCHKRTYDKPVDRWRTKLWHSLSLSHT